MNKKQAWKLFIAFFAAVFLVVSIFFFWESKTEAQFDSGNQNQSDAIGIRVIPNPNHYSVLRWYENKGYSGSPQVLTVDGYEALRDGRSVYINAAHVLPDSKQIYTNIYLISYNQESGENTLDILGQIISHWEFNDNLPAQDSTCSISVVKCEGDVDCPQGQSCDEYEGTCQLDEEKACEVDEDCPTNFFCDSTKAKIIRDLNRVGKLEELKEALTKYKNTNGRYPLLSAGTYLPGKTTSLWPSWTDSFLPSLSVRSNFSDPINRFGACPGFDKTTCWNKDLQQFVYDLGNSNLKLPDDSYALVYSTNPSGSEYNLCAVMESRDSSDPNLGYTLEPNDPTSSNCVTATGILAGGNATNSEPEIVNTALTGVSGKEYNGFVRAVDPDGDELSWEVSSSSSWVGWIGAPPVIKGTSEPNQKKLFAQRAGNPGDYPITITVRDGKGGVTSETFNIKVNSSYSFAEANEYVYRLDPKTPFDYSLYISGSTSLPTFNVTRESGPDVLNMSGINRTTSSDGVNRLKINYKGIISTSTTFTEDTVSIYTLEVTSPTDASSENNFIVKVKVDKPVLDFNCEPQSRIGYEYSCFLGSEKQGNHTVVYSVESPLPTGLELTETEAGDFYIEGTTSQQNDGQEIIVKATNEYGTENTKTFFLKVNNYCGDGIKQSPNTEGKGGIYNNGYEACDGAAGVANSVEASSKSNQYACNTPAGVETPYPISSYDYCIFKSPLDGGGYCGDSYCQGYAGEDISTCEFDCNPNYDTGNLTLGSGDVGDIDCNYVPCPDGYTCVTGICQADCWGMEEVVDTMQFKEGDATLAGVDYEYRKSTLEGIKTYNFPFPVIAEVDNLKWCCADNYTAPSGSSCPTRNYCTYVRIDEPVCVDQTNYTALNQTPGTQQVSCPEGYNNLKMVGITTGGDKCRNPGKPHHLDSGLTDCSSGFFENEWCDRYIYECSKIETVTRCVGDPCRREGSTYEDGFMNEDGECVEASALNSQEEIIENIIDAEIIAN